MGSLFLLDYPLDAILAKDNSPAGGEVNDHIVVAVRALHV